MTELFFSIVNLSASASVLAVVVLLARLLLKKAPKWLHVLLWAMVAVRLICPVAVESQFSRMPEEISSGEYVQAWSSTTTSEMPAAAVSPEAAAPVTEKSPDTASEFSLLSLLPYLWCAGMAAMLLYTFISYWHLKRRVKDAMLFQENIYLSDQIPSPFVLGIFRPRIYLPCSLDEDARPHVLAHERAHIRRGDHLWKPLGFLLLTIHWFNPTLWLCYILLCRDIELACDEKVVKTLSRSQRAEYSQALLNCAVSHRSIAACPIAFGEVGVKARVRNVLSYKKPAFWIILLGLILCIAVAVGFLTDPVSAENLMEKVMTQDGYYITNQEGKTINLVIEKDSLTEECFTPEGCHYSPGIVVPYHTMTDNLLYLKFVRLDGEWLELTFDFADSEYRHGQLLMPYGIDLKTGNIMVQAIELGTFAVWDNQTTYPDAAILEKIVGEREFTVKVNHSIYQQAGHHIAFALNGFYLVSYQEGKAPPIETEPKISMAEFHIFPTEVTSVGMTVLNLPDGAWQSMDADTELNYYLEQQVDGQWARLEPHSEEGLPISDRTIHTIIDSDTDRHLLDWSTLYGALPSGTYRVGIDYYFREEGVSKTLYANFTIDDSKNPAYFLSTMTSDARQCTAEFPPNIEQQYVFNKNQDAQLISLLNTLQPEEFFVGAAVNLKVVINISHSASPVWLYWDGHICQFSFVFDDIRWAVRNDELNAYLETILQYSPANSTYEVYNVAPLNELPETYSQEEAIIDKVVLINEGDIRDNSEVWDEFLKSANSQLPATVRIMKYYSASGSMEAVKNIYDLEFDGNSYYLHYVENGTVKSVHYHNLCRRSGENVLADDERYEEYAFYFLTNSDTIDPTQKVRENDRFAKPGDDPFMVWCDYSVRQKALPLPEDCTKITLEVDLRPYVTVTDPSVIDAIKLLFSEAEATYTPKTYFLGPVLRFHSSDGVDLYLQLDLENDLCTFNGQFYYYGKADHSTLEELWKLLDLTYWPDEIAEHDAFAWYFDQNTGT